MGRLQLGFHSGWISVNFHLFAVVVFVKTRVLRSIVIQVRGVAGVMSKMKCPEAVIDIYPPLFRYVSR